MNVPVSGIILAPASLGIFAFAPKRLSEWTIFLSVFQAAAIINLGGGFGVSPYFFAVMLISARLLPQWLTGRIRFGRDEPSRAHMRTMALFVAWTAISAFVLPVFFAGVPVDDPKLGVDRSYYNQMPLHWSPSNFGQAAYMLLNFIMLLHIVQMSVNPGYLERLQKVFTWTGVCAVAIGLFQILCPRVGIRFPAWLFNSNTGWAQAYDQYFNGITRLSASFVEPSEAAAFLSAWALFELTLVINGVRNSGWHWLCVVGGTVALVETASTTGYLTVALMWSVIGFMTAKGVLMHGRVNVRALLAVSIMVGGALVALLAMPSAQLILNAVVFGKSTSESSMHRMATLGRAVTVFESTLAFGAGLGSNRAMSMLFYVLSNLGLPGILALVWLLYQVIKQYSRSLRQPVDAGTRRFIKAAGAAFAANLLAMIISGAEITAPLLWLLWGMLIAGTRQAFLEPASDSRVESAHFAVDKLPELFAHGTSV